MKLIKYLIPLSILVVFCGLNVVQAQSSIVVEKDEVETRFPDGVTFTLEAGSKSEIESVILTYGTDGRTCQNSSAHKRIEFDPSSHVDLNWEWDFWRSGVIPPGAQIWWQWEIKDKSGFTLKTPVQQIELRDQRHNWKSVSEDGLTVQWCHGDQEFGNALLAIASESIERIEKDMSVTASDEILIIVYPGTEDVRQALLVATDWTGGIAFTDFGIVIAGINQDELEWAESILPHEISHILVSSLVFNCRGVAIPTWLNEGIAQVAEYPPTDEEREQVIGALEKDKLPALNSLQRGFSAYGDDAHLSYLQSKLVVDYLIQEYGADNLGLLLAAIQEGNMINPAMEKVYGFNSLELDFAWRAWMGFPGIQNEKTMIIEDLPAESTPVPTLPLMVLESQAGQDAAASKEPVSTIRASTPTQFYASYTETPAPVSMEADPPAEQTSAWLSAGSVAVVVILLGVMLILAIVLVFRKRGKG